MSELKNSTYWKKNGVVVEANSFVEDEQLRKDGWIKSDRGGYEWYKRSLTKQPPAVEKGSVMEWQDFHLQRFEELAQNSSPEVAAIGDMLMDYEHRWNVKTGDADTALFLASARNIVIEMVKRIKQLEGDK